MNVRKELEAKGSISKGHFVGVSGQHLAGYFNIDPIMPHTTLINKLARQMVEPFKDAEIETVVTPAVGAIPFAHLGALHLQDLTGREVCGVWADKTKHEKKFYFGRSGFKEAVTGKKILVLEDMINQMVSIKKVIALIREAGGDIVGVASVAGNKGVSAKAMNVPMYNRLCLIAYETWTPEECAKTGLCAQKVPIVDDIGHGAEFEASHPDYPGGYKKLQRGN